MYGKQCLLALACALTLGLAVSSSAQEAGGASLSMRDALRIARAPAPRLLRVTFARHIKGTPRPKAVSASAIYACVPAPGYVWHDPNFGSGIPGASNRGTNNVLDDINLPVGITKTGGATLNKIVIDVFNGDEDPQSAPHAIHGVLTIYDRIDTSQASNVAVTPLVSLPFDATGADALPYNSAATVTLTLATPLLLTHDPGSVGKAYSYGVQLATFDDAAHTIYSKTIYPGLAYGNTSAMARIGSSADLLYFDIFDNGLFPANQGASFGPPYTSNLSLELDGSSPDDLTYNVSGTFVFPAMESGSPPQPVTLSFQSNSHPAMTPIVIHDALVLADHYDANGAVSGQESTHTFLAAEAGGLPPDVYTLTVTSPNFATFTQTVTLPATDTDLLPAPPPANANALQPYATTGNLRALNITLTPATAAAAGTIALEGVPNLALVNGSAPLGPFTVEFYTPGAASYGSGAVPVYQKTIAALAPLPDPAAGGYSVSGIPFGVFDVIIKSPLNLAVKAPNVLFGAPAGAVIPGVLLPACDANNDDSVDSSDFGILIGAFNTDSAIPGSGYDPAADFNYDGIIDSSDFALLIGNFNNTGAK